MKYLFVILLLSSSCYAWEPVKLPIDSTTHLVTYTSVITVDSIKQKELYSNAKMWIGSSFKNANNVIQLDDRDNGQIIVKGCCEVYINMLGATYSEGLMFFTLTIKCKDGRYKYIFTNFTHKGNPRTSGSHDCGPIETDEFVGGISGISKKQWNDMKIDCNSKIQNLIASLKESMAHKSTDEKW